MDKLYITRVWLDGHHLFAMTEGGKTAHYDLSTMRGFRHATQLLSTAKTYIGLTSTRTSTWRGCFTTTTSARLPTPKTRLSTDPHHKVMIVWQSH